MSKRNKLLALCLSGIAIIALDRLIARQAHQLILRSDAYFSERLQFANLDFEDIGSAPRKTCQIGKAYHFYVFQTCFVRFASSDKQNEWGYKFVYSKPRPRLALFNRGDTIEDYYFQEAGDGPFGSYLKFVHRDQTATVKN